MKLTEAEVPENLGLKTALSQIMSPGGGVWLLNWVEKHTFIAHGVDVGVVDVVVLVDGVLDVVEAGVVGVVDVVVLVDGVLDVVEGGVVGVDDRDVVEVTKQEQADEIEDEALEHCKATSEGVGPYPWVIVYELQKAELADGA